MDTTKKIKRVGHYDIYQFLAKGKFGDVHLARKDGRDDDLVVKIIPVQRDEKYSSLIFREIEVMKALVDCENVVKYVGDFHTVHFHYIALEYCKGGDLQQHLGKHTKFPENVARKIAYQLLKGIASMHNHPRKIVHRDIKPANILLTNDVSSDDFQLKIGDFGLSKFLYDENLVKVGVDMNETRAGTPLYMSLERIGGVRSGPESDVWAAGVVMYQLLFGITPFPARTEYELVKMISSHAIGTFPLNLNSVEISEECKIVIRKALDPSISSRAKADELLLCKWFDIERRKEQFYQNSPNRKFSYGGMYTSLISSYNDTAQADLGDNANHPRTLYLFFKDMPFFGRKGLLIMWEDENSDLDHAFDCARALYSIVGYGIADEYLEMCIMLKAMEILEPHLIDDMQIMNLFKEIFFKAVDLNNRSPIGSVSFARMYSFLYSYSLSLLGNMKILDVVIAFYIVEFLIRDTGFSPSLTNAHSIIGRFIRVD
jgi:serine/threonine protein kinase